MALPATLLDERTSPITTAAWPLVALKSSAGFAEPLRKKMSL